MHEIDIGRLDLNLLKVFGALYSARSVTVASQQLGLSQSTASHALTRLRDSLGDPLFVRSSRGVQPTRFASMIAGPISQALAMVQEAVDLHKAFDPAISTRTFNILMTDMGEALFGPALMMRIREAAPNVRVVIHLLPRERYKEALEDGTADLALGQLPAAHIDLFQQHLSHEPFFGFARMGHPILEDPTMERFLAADHLIVGKPAVAEAHLVKALGSMASRRRVALEIRHYLSAGPILASTDLVAVLPKTVTGFLTAKGTLGRFAPPIPLEPVTMRQFWHARSDNDTGCKWLRSQVADLFMNRDLREGDATA